MTSNTDKYRTAWIYGRGLSSSFGQNVLVALLLVLISLAALSPMLAPYQMVADDYPHFSKTVSMWIESWGIWRIAGMQLVRWLVSVHVYGGVVIVLHAINGFLFYLVMRRAFGSLTYALFFTVIVIAFPWGYADIIWAASSCFAFANAFLWLVIYLLLTFEPHPTRSYYVAAATTALSFLGLLFNEAIFFCLCAGGIIVWARQGVVRYAWRSSIAVSLAPLIGAALWAALYEATKPPVPFKAIGAINLRSILSGIYYQYANLEVFDVWINNPLREYVQSTILPAFATLSVVVIIAIALLIKKILLADRKIGAQNKNAAEGVGMSPAVFLVCMLVLLLGATGIYALAGGYSLDSRKRYIIVPLLVAVAAAGSRLILGNTQSSNKLPSHLWMALSSICLVGCLTSFMVLSVWRNELLRVNMLAELIAQKRISGSLHIEWNPNINELWPNSKRSWGDAIDHEAVELVFKAFGAEPVVLSADGATRVSWDRQARHWTMLP